MQAAEKEEQYEVLEAELAAAAEVASRTQQRVAVLESEVTALAAQAESAGQEAAEAQQVLPSLRMRLLRLCE